MSLNQLDSNRFEEIIYDNGDPCLVIFTRENCHVCKEIVPMLDNLQSQYVDTFAFYSIDIEKEQNLAQRFPLKGVPSILFFNEGTLRGKLGGHVEDEEVKEKIANVLGA